MKISFDSKANKSNFHMKIFALSPAFMMRFTATQKCPIISLNLVVNSRNLAAMLDFCLRYRLPIQSCDLRCKINTVLLVGRKSEVFLSRSDEKSALAGHVIETLHAGDDLSCAFSCLHTSNCYSFNFKQRSQVCELNHSNKLASAEDLVLDMDSVYYELDFKYTEGS